MILSFMSTVHSSYQNFNNLNISLWIRIKNLLQKNGIFEAVQLKKKCLWERIRHRLKELLRPEVSLTNSGDKAGRAYWDNREIGVEGKLSKPLSSRLFLISHPSRDSLRVPSEAIPRVPRPNGFWGSLTFMTRLYHKCKRKKAPIYHTFI
jgi:hypothetical protein